MRNKHIQQDFNSLTTKAPMNLIHRIIFSAALSLGFVNVSMAAPDTDWPKKPIQMILSFPA
jgi:hypothetical protein